MILVCFFYIFSVYPINYTDTIHIYIVSKCLPIINRVGYYKQGASTEMYMLSVVSKDFNIFLDVELKML